MEIGLFGGSFNPIHTGHCILASLIRQNLQLDEVWLNVSPQNPLKSAFQPDYDRHRVEMVRLATEGKSGLKLCDIEFSMPRPSFTINTLERLSADFPGHRFRVIIGGDNWQCFDKWLRHNDIISKYGVIVYPRPGCPLPKQIPEKNVILIQAPMLDISSTFIRESIKAGQDVDFLVPDKVAEYIKNNKLYL